MDETEISENPTPDLPTDLAPMPDLLGMDIDRALRLLELFGAEKPLITLVPEAGNRGIVVEQYPGPEVGVPPGFRVRLAVESDNPIRLLPEVFQDEDRRALDSVGQDRPPNFLRNFLFISQQLFAKTERDLTHMDRQLSPEGASPSFLPWLCSLIPMEWDSEWSIDRVRQILRDGPQLMLQRGSARGIEEMVELHSGLKVTVHENGWPQQGFVIGAARVSEQALVSTVPSPDDAFYVELPAGEKIERAQLERILRIIDAEKPVHLRCMVYQPPAPPRRAGGMMTIGRDFIVGVTPVSGPVVTPPARIGVPGFVAGPSGDGGEMDPAAWASEGLSAD